MNTAQLKTLLRKQKFNSVFQLIFILLWIFIYILSKVFTVHFHFYGFSNHAIDTSGYTFWLAIDLTIWGFFFLTWVLGIFNAVKINSITKDSKLLIIFSVISLAIGHLIVAILEEKKFGSQDILSLDNFSPIQENTQSNPKNERFKALEEALASGIISLDEYERKMQDLKKREALEEMERSSRRK